MIELKNLSKHFGETQALSHIDLTVPKGSIFGLIGPNGAGKSTLLRTLAGVYAPEEGTVLLEGEAPYENPAVKSRIFFLPDAPYFPMGATLLSLRDFYAPLFPQWDDKFFQQLCQLFPVEEKKKIRNMSKGMQRQAILVCALASRPDYLLLDEVFDGLDPVVRHLLRKLVVGEVAQRSMTVLISTHNLRELEDFCDSLALLFHGGIRLENELDSMKLGLHSIQAVFPTVPRLAALREKIDVVSCQTTGSVVNLIARGDREQILAALGHFSPTLQEVLPLSLEEIFISEMEAAGYEIDNILP